MNFASYGAFKEYVSVLTKELGDWFELTEPEHPNLNPHGREAFSQGHIRHDRKHRGFWAVENGRNCTITQAATLKQGHKNRGAAGARVLKPHWTNGLIHSSWRETQVWMMRQTNERSWLAGSLRHRCVRNHTHKGGKPSKEEHDETDHITTTAAAVAMRKWYYFPPAHVLRDDMC